MRALDDHLGTVARDHQVVVHIRRVMMDQVADRDDVLAGYEADMIRAIDTPSLNLLLFSKQILRKAGQRARLLDIDRGLVAAQIGGSCGHQGN